MIAIPIAGVLAIRIHAYERRTIEPLIEEMGVATSVVVANLSRNDDLEECVRRRRGCLIGVGGLAGLLLLCCVVGWFVGIPRFRDSIESDLSDSISTEVADQIGTPDIGPGRYEISVADMQRQLASSFDAQNIEDFEISVDSSGMAIGFTSSGQTIGYTGVPTVQNGLLVMDNMAVDNSALGFFMPADRLGNAIERGVNSYFDVQGLDIESVNLGNDELIIEAVQE